MNRLYLVLFICLLNLSSVSQNYPLPPDKIYGQLFIDVQLDKIFPDNKTFVDCIPLRNPGTILNDYRQLGKAPAKDALLQFVKANFKIPETHQTNYHTDKAVSIQTHIRNLWPVLSRNPAKHINGESLLTLPYSYIVPGGRFNEIYYWDSYFTMLGLQQSNDWAMIENMIRNFSFLIQIYGHIPNGNRTYYLSRSQPPFFSLMVDLLAENKGPVVYSEYLSSLLKEYNYWTDKTAPTKHVVRMQDGSVLFRYYDQDQIPRQESYQVDDSLAKKAAQNINEYHRFCRDLRSCAESGWDFSSRWFKDGKNISTIQTTNIVPVDLNCLIYHLELTLAKAFKKTGKQELSDSYILKATALKKAINKYCWNEAAKWYVDFVIPKNQQSLELTAAGMTPLFFQVASQKQAVEAASILQQKFLKSGGIVTTLKNTGQQWDAPNGWAPLQWMAVKGLSDYGLNDLANDIAQRWIRLNVNVYNRTGKLMEKYNVENTSLDAGGGEYPGQDGFGWTNGVLLKLIAIYGNRHAKGLSLLLKRAVIGPAVIDLQSVTAETKFTSHRWQIANLQQPSLKRRGY